MERPEEFALHHPDSPLGRRQRRKKYREAKSVHKVQSFRLAAHLLPGLPSPPPADTHYNASRSRPRSEEIFESVGNGRQRIVREVKKRRLWVREIAAGRQARNGLDLDGRVHSGRLH